MLDWAQEHRRNTPKEFPSDGLPTTGSRQDIMRWARENGVTVAIGSGAKRDLRNRPFKAMNQAVEQLGLYLEFLQSKSFHEKSLEHRREIVIGIRRLISRVNTDPRTSSRYARDLVARVQNLISSINMH
jgi:hypothetical protein